MPLSQKFGRLEKSGSSHGAPSDTPGGFPVDSSTGYTIDAVPEESRSSKNNLRRLEHSTGALFGGQTLAGAERADSQSGQSAAEGSPFGLNVGCPVDEGEAAGNGPSIQGAGREKRTGKWSLPLSAMGFGEEGVCAGDARAPFLQRGGGIPDSPQAAIGAPARGGSFPRNAEAHSGDDLRSGPVHARNPEPLSGIPTVLSPARKAQTQLLYPPHSGHAAAGQARSIATGEHSRPLDPRALAQLRSAGRQNIRLLQLQNPSNYCYANSNVLAIAWTIAHTSEAHSTVFADSRFMRFLAWLTTQIRPVTLWHTMQWQTITSHWSRPGQEHDASEFLQSLMQEVFQAGKVGTWESRLQVNSHSPAQAEDCGTTWPLPLSAALSPDVDSSIQNLIDARSAQASPHALSSLPAVLALQIARFTDQGDKCPGKVAPLWSFAMPFYRNDGVDLEHTSYRVTAIIYHVGESILQGHYRAVLFEDGMPAHHTDDGRKAVKLRPRDFNFILCNCYVIFAVKSS